MFATILEICALATILWFSLCAFDQISKSTNIILAVVVCVIFAASIARGWGLFTGELKADLSSAVLLAAFAVGMVVERRRNDSCPCLPNYRQRRENHSGDHGATPA